ncbi:hypothetical protein HGA13_29795 [Nocardia speluncae]|uniref:Uncharacterized protein n=1 Tax=Nocardia speluncae TaxID=419477 RepID=A0A846XUN9_9NOCA|nr:hypothetical protein [Nocardia speluncae]NKY37234.1 hypothetical protein [Nocardia speluncae]
MSKKKRNKSGKYKRDKKGFDLLMVAAKDAIEAVVRPVLGDIALGDLDADIVKSLRDNIVAAGYSDLYADLVRLILCDMIDLAEVREVVTNNVAAELSSSVGGFANFFQRLESGNETIEPESFRDLVAYILQRYVLPIREGATPDTTLTDAWVEVERIAGDTPDLYIEFAKLVFSEAVVAAHRDGYDPAQLFDASGGTEDPYQNLVTVLEHLRESDEGMEKFEELASSPDGDVSSTVLIAMLTNEVLKQFDLQTMPSHKRLHRDVVEFVVGLRWDEVDLDASELAIPEDLAVRLEAERDRMWGSQS